MWLFSGILIGALLICLLVNSFLGFYDRVVQLLVKGAIKEFPEYERNRGLSSQYFLIKKKDGGTRPMSDRRNLNKHLNIPKFCTAHLSQPNLHSLSGACTPLSAKPPISQWSLPLVLSQHIHKTFEPLAVCDCLYFLTNLHF